MIKLLNFISSDTFLYFIIPVLYTCIICIMHSNTFLKIHSYGHNGYLYPSGTALLSGELFIVISSDNSCLPWVILLAAKSKDSITTDTSNLIMPVHTSP